LKFEAVPLSEIVAEFNRYNRHQLVITDPDLAKQKFGGTFRPDGYNTLVHLLEQSFDVVADRHGDIITLHRRGD
jgi:transmembrane sensor